MKKILIALLLFVQASQMLYGYETRSVKEFTLPSFCFEMHLKVNGHLVASGLDAFEIKKGDKVTAIIGIKGNSPIGLTSGLILHLDFLGAQHKNLQPLQEGSTLTEGGSTSSIKNPLVVELGDLQGGKQWLITQQYQAVGDYKGKLGIDFSGTLFGHPFSFSNYGLDGMLLLGQCNSEIEYAPIWGNFNVERANSNKVSTSDPHKRFALYTQLTQSDFELAVVSYEIKNGKHVESKLPTNVELELIDLEMAPLGSKEGCKNAPAITKVKTLKHKTSRTKFNIKSLGYKNKEPKKNLAFRMKLLGADNIAVGDSCKNPKDATCYQKIYNEHLAKKDKKGLCKAACGKSKKKSSKCHDCLKESFTISLCSYDNFAIRPPFLSLQLSEAHNSTQAALITNRPNSAKSDIVAGYDYNLFVNGAATDFKSINGYNQQFEKLSDIKKNTLAEAIKSKNFIIAEFIGQKDCSNKSSYSPSSLSNLVPFRITETGSYKLYAVDNRWSSVDQPGSPAKATLGSCTPNNYDKNCYDCDINNPFSNKPNKAGLIGCDIASFKENRHFITLNSYLDHFDYNLGIYPNQNHTTQMITDLSNNYYQNFNPNGAQGLFYKFDLTAMGYHNESLSNFHKGCMVKPAYLTLELNDTSKLTSALNLYGLQGQGVVKTAFDKNRVGAVSNSGALNFSISQNLFGKSKGRSSFVFMFAINKKNQNSQNTLLPDPFSFYIKALHFRLKGVRATKNQQPYTPGFDATINQQIDYYFARLKAKQSYIDSEGQAKIPLKLYAELYCSKAPADCKTLHNLSRQSNADALQKGWYQADIFSPNLLGKVTLTGTKGTKISQYKNNKLKDISIVSFDSGGSSKGLSIRGNKLSKIKLNPPPWLWLSNDASSIVFDRYSKTRYAVGEGERRKQSLATKSKHLNKARLNW